MNQSLKPKVLFHSRLIFGWDGEPGCPPTFVLRSCVTGTRFFAVQNNYNMLCNGQQVWLKGLALLHQPARLFTCFQVGSHTQRVHAFVHSCSGQCYLAGAHSCLCGKLKKVCDNTSD